MQSLPAVRDNKRTDLVVVTPLSVAPLSAAICSGDSCSISVPGSCSLNAGLSTSLFMGVGMTTLGCFLWVGIDF